MIKRITALRYILLAFIGICGILTGCSDLNFADAVLSEATMCKNVDPKTLAPIDRTEKFPADFKELHCNVKVSNAPAKTKIKAQFIDPNNKVVAESTIEMQGTEYVDFRMARGPNRWTGGGYTVKLYVNDKENTTVKFTIEGEVITDVPQFSEVATCNAVDLKTAKPLDYTSIFPSNFKTIYVSMKVNNAAPDTEIKVRWFTGYGKLILENVTRFSGTGYVSFALDRTGEPWAPGDYAVALFMNGIGDIIVPFLIK